jgi:hypothetical protein
MVWRYDFDESGGDPSEGIMQVTWKFGWFLTNLLVNSSIGTKWLNPGLGITAMWVFAIGILDYNRCFAYKFVKSLYVVLLCLRL